MRKRYVNHFIAVLPEEEAARPVNGCLGCDLSYTACRLLYPLIVVLKECEQKLQIRLRDWLTIRGSCKDLPRSLRNSVLSGKRLICNDVWHDVSARPNE